MIIKKKNSKLLSLLLAIIMLFAASVSSATVFAATAKESESYNPDSIMPHPILINEISGCEASAGDHVQIKLQHNLPTGEQKYIDEINYAHIYFSLPQGMDCSLTIYDESGADVTDEAGVFKVEESSYTDEDFEAFNKNLEERKQALIYEYNCTIDELYKAEETLKQEYAALETAYANGEITEEEYNSRKIELSNEEIEISDIWEFLNTNYPNGEEDIIKELELAATGLAGIYPVHKEFTSIPFEYNNNFLKQNTEKTLTFIFDVHVGEDCPTGSFIIAPSITGKIGHREISFNPPTSTGQVLWFIYMCENENGEYVWFNFNVV